MSSTDVRYGGKRAFLFGCVLLAGCGAPPGAITPAPPEATRPGVDHIVFGAPIYLAGDDGSSARPLITYLSRRLAIRVDLRMAEPYHELPTLLRTGAVDVALLPPLAYVQLRDQTPQIRPIATVVISGNPTYLGHMYVKDSSPFQSLGDLRGARVGYVAPESTSGYLFPRDVLRRKGYDPNGFFSSTRFFGSHPQVLAAVLSGEVDVGAAEDLTTDWLGPHNRPEGLRVIAKTERIPNDCLASRPNLDLQTTQAILQALLELRPGAPQAAAIAASMGVNGWIAADESRYERVRQVLTHENARGPRSPAPVSIH